MGEAPSTHPVIPLGQTQILTDAADMCRVGCLLHTSAKNELDSRFSDFERVLSVSFVLSVGNGEDLAWAMNGSRQWVPDQIANVIDQLGSV